MNVIAATGRPRRIPLHAAVLIAVSCIALAIVGLDGWRTRQSWTVTIADDKVETSNLARSLAQQLHDTIEVADTVLIGLRERREVGGVAPPDLDRLRAIMALRVSGLPIVRGLFLSDAAGNWIASSTKAMTLAIDHTDRPYFQYHRSHIDRGVHLGEPIRSKSDGNWVVTLSRRVDAPDGSFAGVVLASIATDSLTDFYRTFDIGAQGVISLSSADGILIARVPPRMDAIGTSISEGATFSKFQQNPRAASFQYTSTRDGVTRLGSYRRVEGYPLNFLVSHGMDDVLADWRDDAILHLALSGGAALIIVFFGMHFAQQVKQRQQVERRYRLLADNSNDAIICVGTDGRKVYVSPAFTTLTGWSVVESMAHEWGGLVHPDDRAAVAAVRQRLYDGAGKVTVSYRYMCKDGSEIWVEASIRLIGEMDGEKDAFVANIRDITKRKAAEDQVKALNEVLAAQANTDALTGLGNRRSFDAMFLQEWRRAYRETLPLSLLMIDVDHFKLLNDRYGHQKGDEALRDVAAAIATCIKRPGDFAARYGGEEIVVVLPGTDASGADMMGNRIRTTIEALQIPNADHEPGQVVTVSVGTATLTPRHYKGADGCHALLETADNALYTAKRSGRNRVVSAALATPSGSFVP